ncbi:MAG: Unknown protein [uncultured Sulfurovum sp.]|uniref:Prokaryotic RING finger family 4 n=1 Tax=uncultured Sulfurovum sp. TaxID=269237 RepID=A0A6S6TPP1_9BACT|nr:MAG: Unknown protein [uncultured Sulfurovum sp.]
MKVALRQNAIVIFDEDKVNESSRLNATTSVLVANVADLGFGFSEALLHATNQCGLKTKQNILALLQEVMGTDKNWTPLVKGWDTPTNESLLDYVITFFANTFKTGKGTYLSCGHLIPENTFPLERYNGCPYCGQAMEASDEVFYGQGSSLKVLELWDDEQLQAHYLALLASKTALDATQVDSLKILLAHYPLPSKVNIEMKETLMLVIDILVENEKLDEAGTLFKSPQEIMRYLWFKKTGFLQLVEPKSIVKRKAYNRMYYNSTQEELAEKTTEVKNTLKLKYSRKECKMVASWMNNLALKVENSCELMHPKRAMWVRFIRALRLAEYAKRKEFLKLKVLLDVFYNKKYSVWLGELEKARLTLDEEKMFERLKEKPSVFARSLFANMLWFGEKKTLAEFTKVSEQIPARLLVTLGMYASSYFDIKGQRIVKPLGGGSKRIDKNQSLKLYSEKQLKVMIEVMENLVLEEMSRRYAKIENTNETYFMDELLFKVPLAIGDRAETIQDMPSVLMGQKFSVEGQKVRLFMEWGKGLPAQYLDMDISCHVAFDDRSEYCSYSNLIATGCTHSGDIQDIPHMVGTAEYIELDLERLSKANATFVTFSGNSYSSGELENNMVVGWMNSKDEMTISKKTGVAYDPSTVQHQIRISNKLSEAIVFGVLDVKNREITWLEMDFNGQTIQSMDTQGVRSLLTKLESKMSVGELVKLKTEAQGLRRLASSEEADEVYDAAWVQDTAKVTQLLLD